MLASEGPQHHVVISKPFYMAATEVTVGQFRKFVEAKGYKTAAETDGKGGGLFEQGGVFVNRPELNWKNPGVKQNEDTHPVPSSPLPPQHRRFRAISPRDPPITRGIPPPGSMTSGTCPTTPPGRA